MSKAKESKKGKQEKKPEEKPKINFEELIIANLSNPQITFDYSGYQFTELDVSCKGLDSLSNIFLNYKHIQTINLQGNNIVDFSILGQLPFLVKLNVSENIIKDIKGLINEENFKNLKFLNAAKNKITELPGIKAPNLLHLILNENLIDKAEGFEGHPKIRKLELRGNKIANTAQLINMPELKELYLCNNKIKTIIGFDLQNLQILHLRQNLIEAFEETFPNMENLQYLNLRENKISNLDEFQKLVALPNLRVLIHSFNPLIIKNQMYLFDTINMLLKLTRINKQAITKNVKLKAFKYAEDKFNQALEAKKKAEEEEKRKQEMAEQQQQQGEEQQ